MAQYHLGLCLIEVYNELSFQAMVKNSFGFNFDIFVVLKVGVLRQITFQSLSLSFST